MIMANVYDVGDGVRLTNTFSIDGSGANPTTVTVTITDPDGNTYAPSAGSGTDGVYIVKLPDSGGVVDEIGTPGEWSYRWVGTGAVIAATEGHFFVRKRRADE